MVNLKKKIFYTKERKKFVFHNNKIDIKTPYICETCGVNVYLISCHDLHRNKRYKINNLIK